MTHPQKELKEEKMLHLRKELEDEDKKEEKELDPRREVVLPSFPLHTPSQSRQYFLLKIQKRITVTI